MLAQPEGVEAKLFGPFADRQNLFIILLVGTAQIRMVVAKNKDAEFHVGRLLLQEPFQRNLHQGKREHEIRLAYK